MRIVSTISKEEFNVLVNKRIEERNMSKYEARKNVAQDYIMEVA